MNLTKGLWLTLAVSAMSLSCGVYSFSGVSIGPEVETISIGYFYDNSGSGPPFLAQQFTEAIKDYYQQNTNLTLVPEEGDLQIEGEISGYAFAPLAARGGDDLANATAELQRLTIRVQASYINIFDDTFDFDQSFSFYADYNPTEESVTQAEERLIEEITDAIILDIFNSSVANW